MPIFHSAYSLTIQSDFDLLIPTIEQTPPPDVSIRFGTVPAVNKNKSGDRVWYEFVNKDLLRLKWDILGSYQIQAGKEILIQANEPVNHEDIRQPILGTIMALILQQRGNIVLHGSAVLLDNQVTIFVGNKGEGKSTLAAWLNKQGFPLLSDDICAMDYDKDQPISIRPAFSKIKLRPDTLRHLGEDPEQYPAVHPRINKHIRDMGDGFCTTPRQLRSICILETGDKLKIEQLNGMEAIKEILKHMLVNRFPENQPAELRQEIFTQATYLAKTLPVYRLTRPRDLNLLPETTRLLQNLM